MKTPRNPFLTGTFLLCSVSFWALCAQAQNSQNPGRNRPTPTANPAPMAFPDISTPAGLSSTLQSAERTQNAESLLYAYGQSITDPLLARTALTQLLANYYLLRNQATTAEQAIQAINEADLRFSVLQAAQNQVIIQQNQQLLLQNQRILELLEKQARPVRNTPATAAPRP